MWKELAHIWINTIAWQNCWISCQKAVNCFNLKSISNFPFIVDLLTVFSIFILFGWETIQTILIPPKSCSSPTYSWSMRFFFLVFFFHTILNPSNLNKYFHSCYWNYIRKTKIFEISSIGIFFFFPQKNSTNSIMNFLFPYFSPTNLLTWNVIKAWHFLEKDNFISSVTDN